MRGLPHRTGRPGGAPGLLLAALATVLTTAGLWGCGPDDPGGGAVEGTEQEVITLIETGKTEEAELRLKGLDASDRARGWALYCFGRLALARAQEAEEPDFSEGESLFQEAVAADPGHYMARVFLGRVLGCTGRFVKAIKTLEDARSLSPDRADAWFELGRIYVSNGEIEAAVSAVEKGLGLEPERADGLLIYGEMLYHHRHQPDEGLRNMRRALELDPDLPGGRSALCGVLFLQAQKAMNRQRFDDVLCIVEEMLQLEPDRVAYLKLRAQVYEQTGATPKALEAFRRCVELEPSDQEARTLLARCLVKRGYQLLLLKKREEALALFKEALNLEAKDVDLAVVARILEGDGEAGGGAPREEAPRNTAQAERMKEARSLFEQATTLLEAGAADQALPLLLRSLELLPENPFARHQTGLALDMLGRTDEAVEELELALSLSERLNIRLPTTYLKLAEIAIRGDDYETAQKYLNQHAERFPDQTGTPAARKIRRLLLLGKNRDADTAVQDNSRYHP